MTSVLQLRARRVSVPRALETTRESLGLAALASLFLPSSGYPTALQIGPAQATVQDLLFGMLIAVVLPDAWRSLRARRAAITLLAAFFVTILASALRSPVGVDALVAAGKYIEFVAVGVAIAIVVKSLREPQRVTIVLALGTGLHAIVGLADLIGQGPAAILTARGNSLLGTGEYAAAAALTLIWSVSRLTWGTSRLEQQVTWVAIAVALTAFVAAKSALVLGCGAALLCLAPTFATRWLWRGAVVCVVLVAVVIIGRASDATSLLGADRGAPSAASSLIQQPARGAPLDWQLPYERITPPRLNGGSFTHRIALAHLGVHMAETAPLWGYGWLATSTPSFLRDGPWDSVMQERFPRLDPNLLVSNNPTASHNAYIQTAAETGILGMLLLVGVLSAALAAGAGVVARERRLAPWWVACGLGWSALTAAYLTSSTLFGGQLQTAVFGMGLGMVLQAPTTRRRPKHWLIGMAALAAAAAPMIWFIAARPGGDAPPLSSVVVRDAGTRVDGLDHRFGNASTLEVDNGLLSIRLVNGRLTAGSGRSLAYVRALTGSSVRGRLLVRSANQVSVTYGTARCPNRLVTTLVRGVPGVYLSPEGSTSRAGTVSVRAPRQPILGAQRPQVVTDPVPAAEDVTPLLTGDRSGSTVVALLEDAVATERERTIRIASEPKRRGTFFVAREPAPRAGTPGTYLAPAFGTPSVRVVRSAGPPEALLGRWIPYMLSDRAWSGTVRSASLAANFRAGALAAARSAPKGCA